MTPESIALTNGIFKQMPRLGPGRKPADEMSLIQSEFLAINKSHATCLASFVLSKQLASWDCFTGFRAVGELKGLGTIGHVETQGEFTCAGFCVGNVGVGARRARMTDGVASLLRLHVAAGTFCDGVSHPSHKKIQDRKKPRFFPLLVLWEVQTSSKLALIIEASNFSPYNMGRR